MINKDVTVIIATHKKANLPNDKLYLPVYVGSKLHSTIIDEYQRDDCGENISHKNPYYCELTGLYWAWKNLNSKYIGLVHYRRLFSIKKNKKDIKYSLKYMELVKNLNDYKIFLPKKRHYYIETIYSHYANTFDKSHLDLSRTIIADKFPEYLNSFDEVMNSRSAYMFNMFILERELLNDYCSWLFSILLELEDKIDFDSLNDFNKRLFGRVSEILFNVWLKQQIHDGKLSKKDIKTFYVLYVGGNKFFKKLKAFLAAKFFKKKYEKSF